MAGAAGAAVEVRGVPPEVADELLVLYFENRRRSGGGPVLSCCRRRGGRALLTFDSPDDAQRVLSKATHVLQEACLAVQPAAPRDYGKVVLRGLSPLTSRDLLELYVERMLDCERGGYSLYRSPAGDQALVQLPQPISQAEFLALAARVQGRGLEGAAPALDWVEQTDSLLVRGAGGGARLKKDLLELYFESRRSGGGPVRAVRVLRGGTGAVVSFQNRAVVGRVLQKPHQLEGVSLDVSPHYDFLEPLEEEEEEEEEEEKEATIAATAAVEEGALPADGGIPLTGLPLPEAALRQLLQSSRALQELAAPVPECSLHLEGARLCVTGGDPARRRQLQEHVRATLEAAVQERLPFSAWVLGFLQQEDVRGRLAELLAERQVVAGCLPRAEEVLVVALAPSSARLAASLLGSLLGSFALALSERHLLALGSPRWAQVEASLRCCQVRLAESGDQLEGLTLAGLEEENLARLEAFLQDSAPDEALVAAEPAPLRYLQRYHQDLLASISDVALLPLEEPDVTGLRLSGEAQACRAAAELLQSLLGAIHTETVVLQLPGIQRFLLEDRGQAIVRDLERRFQCILGLEHLHWHPPETQHELEWSQEPLALGCQRENRHGSGPPGGVAQDQSEASLEEIKDLLAALQPNLVDLPAADGDWWPLVSGKGEEEEDLYTDPGQAPAGAPPAEEEEEEEEEAGSLVLEVPEEEASPQGAGSLLGPEGSVEEEAQLLLAIQESMDSVRREEEELRQATELSRCSWEKEQQRGPSPDGALWSALSMSLQELEAARVVACVGSKEQAAPLARELEATLRAQLREEKVANGALSSLPALCQDYLAYLERKHAVRILLAGTVATVQGFADYPVAATRDLALLLTRLLQAEGPACPGSTRWVRWEPSGDGSPTPYPAETSALLEQAWHRGLKRVDVFFGGRPFIIDLERMEEHDLGNAQTLPIGRIEPPPPAAPSAPPALAEDKGQLVPLSEASEEFRQTVRHFYDTLRGLHNKIHIVKVEKLVHPLLHQQYQLKKAAMEKACGHQQVERLLYHGTTEESSREICQHGFNRSFCGRNATHYGHGVYFAASAFLSAQEKYSPASSSSGNKYIFVAQTLVGDYTTGSQSMRAPPLREGDAVPRRYDSTVDNPRDPSIFVIFNDTQAYPQYLITCRWSNLR